MHEDIRPGPAARGALPRRRFLDGFLGAAVAALAAAVVYPVLRFVSPPRIPESATNRVLAGKVPELAKEGWKIFPFGAEAGILIEKAPNEFVALSATCTHLECTVQYEKSSNRIWCACHNGYYDVNGKNIAGPPPRPLTAYAVQVVGEDIFVSKG